MERGKLGGRDCCIPTCVTCRPLMDDSTHKKPLIYFDHQRSIEAVEKVQGQGKICVLDIDVQGVQKVKKSSLEPYYCFIAPPSKEDLEKRLRGRGTETEEQIKTRLGNAAKELEYG